MTIEDQLFVVWFFSPFVLLFWHIYATGELDRTIKGLNTTIRAQEWQIERLKEKCNADHV